MKEIHWPDCDRGTCTLSGLGLTATGGCEAADVARAKGWAVGTVVEGDEGHGVTRLTITAIGLRQVLGTAVYASGNAGSEGPWTFACRCWREVTP